jgi:hypothetical protein
MTIIQNVNNLPFLQLGNLNDDDFSINSAIIEDFKCQQREAAHVQAYLTMAKAPVSLLQTKLDKESLEHANQTESLIQETIPESMLIATKIQQCRGSKTSST